MRHKDVWVEEIDGYGRDGKEIKDAALIALVNNINPSLFQVHYYE
jgi:hypothetical protein